MAATNAQITALEKALYSGELRVQYGDRSVQYRSIEELKAALAEARASQAVSAGTRTRFQRLFAGSDK